MAKIITFLFLILAVAMVLNKKSPSPQIESNVSAEAHFSAVPLLVKENAPEKDKQSVQQSWTELNTKVSHLGDEDQRGLDNLYSEAKTLIEKKPVAVLDYFRNSMANLVQQKFVTSFFEVNSWIRYSKNPTALVDALLDYTPPADPADKDVHHEELTPAVRYRRLVAYGVREMRKQYESGNIIISEEAKAQIVSKIAKQAATEKSLDVTLEITQFLSDLGESQALNAAIAGHSPRDQGIILSALNSQ